MLWSPSQDRLLLVKRIDKDLKWEVPFELSLKAGQNMDLGRGCQRRGVK